MNKSKHISWISKLNALIVAFFIGASFFADGHTYIIDTTFIKSVAYKSKMC